MEVCFWMQLHTCLVRWYPDCNWMSSHFLNKMALQDYRLNLIPWRPVHCILVCWNVTRWEFPFLHETMKVLFWILLAFGVDNSWNITWNYEAIGAQDIAVSNKHNKDCQEDSAWSADKRETDPGNTLRYSILSILNLHMNLDWSWLSTQPMASYETSK
jgi:hypothetical protein